jgi:mRNA interferase MazF
MDIRRGAVVTVALPGAFGKPRPAIVLRSNHFAAHQIVSLVPVSSFRRNAPLLRVDIAPSTDDGLTASSQAMIDTLQSVRIRRIGGVIGQLDTADLRRITRAVAMYLGFAD